MNHLLYKVVLRNSETVEFVSRINFQNNERFELTTDENFGKLFTLKDATEIASTITGEVQEVEWQ